METIQESVIAIPAFIAALIFGIKKAVGEEIVTKYKKYIPLVAMAIGAVVSAVLSISSDASQSEVITTTLQGVVIGAAAVGYREVVNNLK